MPISYPYTQYGGIWKLNAASAAQGAGTWAVPPTPKLFSWGRNTYGQIGIGNIISYSSPKQVGSLTNWITLATTYYSGLATKTDGTLWSWGRNNFGQLGLGSTTDYSSPKQVGSLTNWQTVYGSQDNYDQFVLAIKTDGSLWSWGGNGSGQLGLGNSTKYSSPKQVGSLTNCLKISAGQYHVLATKTDGTLWSWGDNTTYGALGLGNRTNYSSPKQIGALTTWSTIAAGYAISAAIKSDGTLWTWGRGASFGATGHNNLTNYSSPVQVGSLTNWANISIGFFQMIAIKTDGTLWSWGANNLGQLGLGNTTYYSSPKQIGALTNWSSTSCGNYHVLSIKTDGTLWSWGNNNYGQLGINNITQYSSPKQVGSLTSWINIAASYAPLAIAKT